MDCAVPGLGGGALTVPPPPLAAVPVDVPVDVLVEAVALAVLASFGAPTRCIVWEATSTAIICARAPSSTLIAWLSGSEAAAKAAPKFE